MIGYEKIKKFVSEVHEINCALTDEIIEFIDEVILQEQVGNVAKAGASAERISSVICNYERIPKGDFMEFKKGDRVVDDDGRYGIVVDAKNIHNIIVEYDGKNIGSGMYCVDKTCIEYDRLKKVRS